MTPEDGIQSFSEDVVADLHEDKDILAEIGEDMTIEGASASVSEEVVEDVEVDLREVCCSTVYRLGFRQYLLFQ